MTEAQLQQTVIEIADLFGWQRYHTHDSRRSAAGWPDWVFCRPPRLVLAELKTAGGGLRPAQRTWLRLLRQCPGVETYLWRPTDLDEIARILR